MDLCCAISQDAAIRLCSHWRLAAIFRFLKCTTQSGDCAKQNHSIKAFFFGHFTQYKVSTMNHFLLDLKLAIYTQCSQLL